MQALLFFLILILMIWIIVRETGILNKMFPYKKISIMDLAEFSWIPSTVRDNWDKKIINDVIPFLKKDIKDSDTKLLNSGIDSIHKMYKDGTLTAIKLDTPDTKPDTTNGTTSTYSIRVDQAIDMFKKMVKENTTKDGVSGYSVRI